MCILPPSMASFEAWIPTIIRVSGRGCLTLGPRTGSGTVSAEDPPWERPGVSSSARLFSLVSPSHILPVGVSTAEAPSRTSGALPSTWVLVKGFYSSSQFSDPLQILWFPYDGNLTKILLTRTQAPQLHATQATEPGEGSAASDKTSSQVPASTPINQRSL